MISKLIDVLNSIGLELTAEDVADILWLAYQMVKVEATELTMPLDNKILSRLLEASSTSVVEPLPQQENAEALRSTSTPAPVLNGSGIHLSSHQDISVKGTEQGGMPIRSPAASALPDALGIARTLRPLKRGIPSNTRFLLDENATARQIAEQGLWLPVLKPVMTRWLEVALVVDEGASMFIWQQTIAELQILLEHHGAFRDVRTWGLATDADDEVVRVYARIGYPGRGRQVHNPRELLHPKGQRLMLVVTDCVSPVWHNGAMGSMLAIWGRSNPVALIQVLPQRLWPRTSLGGATPIYMRAPFPGASNMQLQVQQSKYWLGEEPRVGLPLPIVTLEPRALVGWARMVGGTEDAWTPGFLLNTSVLSRSEGHVEASEWSQETSAVLDAAECIQRFRTTASPLACKLAELLAAAPISLPVVRLIQRTMLPQSRQVHIAEVFLGGLLEKVSLDGENVHPEYVQYEFVDGVRELLLNSVSVADALHVLQEVSDFVESRFGQTLDFRALLANPGSAGEVPLDENSRPFAILAAKVLQRLGGKYAELAERLEQAAGRQIDGVHSPNLPADIEPLPGKQKKSSAREVPLLSLANRGFINPFYKIRCPFCNEVFYPGDCAIVSRVNQGKILQPEPQGYYRRLFSRIWLTPLTGPKYVVELACRQCPNCHRLLPHNIEHVDKNITIAIVGDTFSGKSHYIAALIDQLRRIQLPDRYFRVIAASHEIENIYLNEFYRPLFNFQKPLLSTRFAVDIVNEPLIYEITLGETERRPRQLINLQLYDVSGEEIAHQETMANYHPHILNADAIIFLADPWSMLGFVGLLALHFRPDSSHLTGRLTSEVLSWVIATFQRYKGQVRQAPFSIPVAITLSKSDLIPYLLTVGAEYGFLADPSNQRYPNAGDTEIIDQWTRRLLSQVGEDRLLGVARGLKTVKFFAVSATGSSVDANGQFSSIRPYRCLDPLFWILSELDVIDKYNELEK